MISSYINELLNNPSSGAIRKMFEEGALLKQKYGFENVYDFTLGNPSMKVPQKVMDAIKKVSSDEEHGYMQNAGFDFARLSMAKKTSLEQGVNVSPENIVMACGAAAALNVTLKTLLNPNDEVIVSAPYFTEYDHYIKNHNGVVLRVQSK
ncbi:MAG: aminotransferase class I/II-fold pyridoxal phosphate-dependent enzyme, partial [Treponema sp.]|nr:aminotransferase class I/II-fold pyridoxal phosphate-dependent enzyme [Treponema sp.]